MVCFHDTAGAEDATHQTFLLLADHLDKVTDIRSKRTGNYIVSIVKNYCRTLLRKKKYQIVDDDIENLAFEIPDDSASVEDQVIDADSEERLVSLIGTLRASYRDAFLLRYYHHMSDDEIAEFLGISKNNVTVRIHRARQKLQEMLSEERSANIEKTIK